MFKDGDNVKVTLNGEQRFGKILEVNDEYAEVLLYDDDDVVIFKKEDVAAVQDVFVNYDDFAKFARFEKTAYDLVGNDGFAGCIVNKDNYRVTAFDLLAVLNKIEKNNVSPDEFERQWFCWFYEKYEIPDDDDEKLYCENDIFRNFLYEMQFALTDKTDFNTELMKNEIQSYIDDLAKPITERRYPDYIKEKVLARYDSDVALNNASDDVAALYKSFALELCEKGIRRGLLAVGYGCYGGNRVFSCNWKKAEECMLKLIDTTDYALDQAVYANTLSYIYYYGRCSDGVAQYEKAYKYFSFAAFNGIYEANYKIADIYKNGYGGIKSIETAEKIINQLYDENIKYIANGEFDCKFADIALRKGSFYCDDKDICNSDFEEMLYYYMQADFAIRMRMKYTDCYGDSKVCAAIQKALAETKELMEFSSSEQVDYYALIWVFSAVFSVGDKLELEIKPLENNSYKMIFRNHTKGKRMFITIPEIEMCGMYEKSEIVFVTDEIIDKNLQNKILLVDEIKLNEFMCDNKSVLKFNYGDCKFIIKAPDNKSENTYKIASVCFSEGSKLYDYLCDDESIKVNDKVTVFAGGEHKTVRVVRITDKKESELSLPAAQCK